ncbi:Hypothetical predicted protein [Octopus vulgaris]|uniref:General transcription factor II-I repeat domain-containing protein 2-like n=1 Tax=Octopus vulgaris TaxID=6645 RepID=A0AA36B1B0_OCTVU|nr:Hypothetical predicted protein [Octopus vulgaris]
MRLTKYNNLQEQLRRQKENKWLADLKKQQSALTQRRDTSQAVINASYLVESKPYCEGEFVKTCILKAAETVCTEKRQTFANISLTRNAVAGRISDLSADLDRQLKHKVKTFIAFSVAIDESTDITDVAQLTIFILGVDKTLTVTKEFLDLPQQ